jgi:sulfotransferase family protein
MRAPKLRTVLTEMAGGVPWVRPPLWRRVPRRLRRELGSRVCLDLGRDHRSAVFVAGSGRSGTSWLAELINYRNEYHYIFEPFHPPEADTLNPMEPGLRICRAFGYHQYLRPESDDPMFLRPAAAVLAGKARSQWTERFNERLVARRRIVKDVKANLILKWLSVNFPGMPMVFILRHPCAVAASRRSLRWDLHWDLVLGRTLRQKELVEDFLAPYLDLFRTATTYVEQQVLMWCIDNFVPLKQFSRDQIHVVFYESLVASPAQELPRLFAYLGKSIDPSVYEVAGNPSLLSDWNSPVLAGARRTDHWRTVLARSDIDRALAVLAEFGLDEIYSEDPLPQPAGLDRLMAPAAAAVA